MSNFLRLLGGAAKEVNKRREEQRAKALELQSIEQKAQSTAFWENYFDGTSTSTFDLGNGRSMAFKPVVGEGISATDVPIITREKWTEFGELDADEQAAILNNKKARGAFYSTVVNPLILEKSETDIQKSGPDKQLGTRDLEQLWGDRSTWTPSEIEIFREIREGTGLSNRIVNPTMKERYGDDWDDSSNTFSTDGRYANMTDVNWLNSKGNIEQQIGTFFKGPRAKENYVTLGENLFENNWSNQNKDDVYDAINDQLYKKRVSGIYEVSSETKKEPKRQAEMQQAYNAEKTAFKLLSQIGILQFGSVEVDANGVPIEGTFNQGEMVTGPAFSLRRTVAGMFGRTGQISQLRTELTGYTNRYADSEDLRRTNEFLMETTGKDIRGHMSSLVDDENEYRLKEDGKLYTMSEGQERLLSEEDQTAAIASLQIALAFTIAIANQGYEGGKAVSDADFIRAFQQITGEDKEGGLFARSASLEQTANIHATLFGEIGRKAFDAEVYLRSLPGEEEEAAQIMNRSISELASSRAASTGNYRFVDRIRNPEDSLKLRFLFFNELAPGKTAGSRVRPAYTLGLNTVQGKSDTVAEGFNQIRSPFFRKKKTGFGPKQFGDLVPTDAYEEYLELLDE